MKDPIPNCPYLPLPHAHAVPSLALNAITWCSPHAKSLAVKAPKTETGELLSVVVPLPSFPYQPAPQHFTTPPAPPIEAAQAKRDPQLILLA